MIDAIAAPLCAVADLVLLRMMLTPDKPPGPAIVRKDVGKLLHDRDLTPEEFASVRDDLIAAGFLEKKGRTIRLTETGREQALNFAGLVEMPPHTTWEPLKSRFLFAKAAGLTPEAAAKLTEKKDLAAFQLKRKFGLPTSAGSTVNQVLEALVCRQLGRPQETTLEGLLQSELSRLIGSDAQLTRDQLAAQLPLYKTGIPNATAENFRLAILREWLQQGSHQPTAEAEPDFPQEFDRAAFAETVRALARTSPATDRFHDNKVFISALWRASQREDGFPRMTLAEFKSHLVEANTAGLLRLSRADLVQAMPPDLVAESRTEYLHSDFHFVLVEEGRS